MIFTPARTPAHRTAALARMMGGAPKRRLPKQVPPTTLENKYAARLIAWVDSEILPAFDELEDALPRLLASAHAEARIDGARYDAGEGKKIRELIDRARTRMKDVLKTEDLEKLASGFARDTASYNRAQLGKQTRAALGADIFMQDKRVGSLMEVFVDTNVGLVTKLTDEVAGRVETSVLRAVQDAKPWDEFRDELAEQFGFSRSRAELIARDQIGKFYGQANAARQRELGVTHFIWRTSGDERVRDEHAERNGERYSYDDPPDGELPGEPILCRCSAEPDFSDIINMNEEPIAETEKPAARGGTFDESGIPLSRRFRDGKETTVSSAAALVARGLKMPAGEGFGGEGTLNVSRLEEARRAMAEGQREAIKIGMNKKGELEIINGRHRFEAAREKNLPIRVKWYG